MTMSPKTGTPEYRDQLVAVLICSHVFEMGRFLPCQMEVAINGDPQNDPKWIYNGKFYSDG